MDKHECKANYKVQRWMHLPDIYFVLILGQKSPVKGFA